MLVNINFTQLRNFFNLNCIRNLEHMLHIDVRYKNEPDYYNLPST